MDYAKLRRYRHADPSKVRQVWDALTTVKAQRATIPVDKVNKILRKTFKLKDDQIRLLLDEIEGDGLIEKIEPSFGKNGVVRYQLPDYTKSCPRGKHDWYCFQCHEPGEVLRCLDCFRVYHSKCAQEASSLNSPSRRSVRSPTLHDGHDDNFTCPVCESRPKCEFSRKQIRKLLEFATHHLRKQPLWKTFLQIGYQGEIRKNEYLVYKYTDLELLQQKIKDGRYAALEEFSMDVQLLVHDICILCGPYSNQADEIRFFLRSVNVELSEIQLCTDCYINAKARVSDWISKPCKPRHELIWAKNRTSAGVGLFNDMSVSQFYWPAKVLLERDDGYEIRFFGGSHERMFVKKSHTRPFHLPADEVGVLRRSNTTGTLPGGGFEKAWNEVSKLQANIDSGYYSHSSGESDLPPSDDDYSDELYLGPRRKTINNYQRSHRADSPRSSLTSGNTKGVKRRRHTSSSSHQTTTSATPIGESLSPTQDTSPHAQIPKHFKSHGLSMNPHSDPLPNDKRSVNNRLMMPTVQPGTPGAAAMSALAETKAAMAAAVGTGRRSTNSFTADLLTLTHREQDTPLNRRSKDPCLAKTRGQRGRGRPPLRNKTPQVRRSKYASSSSSPRSSEEPSSSISSGSLSDPDNTPRSYNVNDNTEHNWRSNQSSFDWKTAKKTSLPRRGRPPKSRGVVKMVGDSRRNWCSPTTASSDAEDSTNMWLKSESSVKPSPTRGRPKSSPANNLSTSRNETIGKKRMPVANKKPNGATEKKPRRPPKQLDGFGDSVDKPDEDDELTDRCVSPIMNDIHDSRRHSTHSRRSSHLIHSSPSGAQLSPNRRVNNTESSHINRISPTKRVTSVKHRSSHSSNFSSCSSPSTSDVDDDVMVPRRQRPGIAKVDDDDRRFRSPTRGSSCNKDYKLTGGSSSTMLRRPPFAPPLNTSTSSGANISAFSDRANISAVTNLFSQSAQNFPVSDANSLANSPTNTGLSGATRLSSSSHPFTGNSASTSSPLAVGATTNTSGTNSVVVAPGMSTLPRSHLPPNKRAAAAATAAALNRDSLGGPSDVQSSESLQQRQPSVRSPDLSNAVSPRKQLHKGIQTPASMELPQSTSLQVCSQCKDREAERLAASNEMKRVLRELEDKLTAQFKEEKAALHMALEQAQTSARETVENERKLAHETLEAAEARFNEVIVQTKRRQWCRNCLSEAIYHCCWNTSYCSTQCQQEHWQKEHKRQCRRKR